MSVFGMFGLAVSFLPALRPVVVDDVKVFVVDVEVHVFGVFLITKLPARPRHSKNIKNMKVNGGSCMAYSVLEPLRTKRQGFVVALSGSAGPSKKRSASSALELLDLGPLEL